MDNSTTLKLNAPVEPVLEMEEIQGLAIPGFRKQHMTLVGIRYTEDQVIRNFKKLLHTLYNEISTAAQTLANRQEYRKGRAAKKTRSAENAPDTVLTAVGFSYTGLKKLTPGVSDIPSMAYKLGLVARSPLLGDPTDPKSKGNPANWVVGSQGAELDALFVVAGDTRESVDARTQNLTNRLKAISVETPYNGNGDIRADRPGHEHFGFEDGVSQPGVRGRASNDLRDYVEERCIDPGQVPEAWLFGRPGQDLVWPGEFILGYPSTSPDPLVPGPDSQTIPEWTKNGSYLVFRRLRQDVGLFWRTMQMEAQRLAKLPGFDNETDEVLAARLVGRWQSGAPVNRVTNGDNESLGADSLANNNFRFDSDSVSFRIKDGYMDPFPMAKADPAGITCPWAAHIRKVNVRDSGSDMGGRDSTYSRRILRTGIPFGKPLANRYAEDRDDPEKGNRGLLFLCIQSSIEEQFEFLMARWMGDPSRPKTPGGHDLLVGQNGSPGERRERRCTLFGKGLQQVEISTKEEWIIPTGGGYFFLPSITAIRNVLGK